MKVAAPGVGSLCHILEPLAEDTSLPLFGDSPPWLYLGHPCGWGHGTLMVFSYLVLGWVPTQLGTTREATFATRRKGQRHHMTQMEVSAPPCPPWAHEQPLTCVLFGRNITQNSQETAFSLYGSVTLGLSLYPPRLFSNNHNVSPHSLPFEIFSSFLWNSTYPVSCWEEENSTG